MIRFVRMTQNNGASQFRCVRGFTLIELLVVVAIIAVLLGILLPALSGARDTARTVRTQALMREVLNSIQQFQSDNNRMPGFFNHAQMASTSNSTKSSVGQGFTEMENVLLEIAGGIVNDNDFSGGIPDESDPSTNIVRVGPLSDNTRVFVDIARVGREESHNGVGGYLILPTTELFPVQGQAGVQSDINASAWETTDPEITTKGMPDIIDAFGQPIMLWRKDDTSPLNYAALSDPSDTSYFVDVNYNPDDRPAFYWASNAGYLGAGEAGNSTNGDSRGLGSDMIKHAQISLIGKQAVLDFEDSLLESMTALLGSPAFPVEREKDNDPWRPAEARGSIVVHSVGAPPPQGADLNAFLWSGHRPGETLQKSEFLSYSPKDRAPISDSGATRSVDDFDDMIMSVGN